MFYFRLNKKNIMAKLVHVNMEGYGKLYGCTASNVSIALKKGKKLPGVKKVKNFGRIKILVINPLEVISKKNAKLLQKNIPENLDLV